MLKATDTKHAPWYIVRSDDKKRARLNCIAHLLSLIPYKKVPREKVKLPKRSKKGAYDDQRAKRPAESHAGKCWPRRRQATDRHARFRPPGLPWRAWLPRTSSRG